MISAESWKKLCGPSEERGVFRRFSRHTQDFHCVTCSEAGRAPMSSDISLLCPVCSWGVSAAAKPCDPSGERADPSFLGRGGGEERAVPEQEPGHPGWRRCSPLLRPPVVSPQQPTHRRCAAPPRPAALPASTRTGSPSPLLAGAHSSCSLGAPFPWGSPFLQYW